MVNYSLAQIKRRPKHIDIAGPRAIVTNDAGEVAEVIEYRDAAFLAAAYF